MVLLGYRSGLSGFLAATSALWLQIVKYCTGNAQAFGLVQSLANGALNSVRQYLLPEDLLAFCFSSIGFGLDCRTFMLAVSGQRCASYCQMLSSALSAKTEV